MQVRNVPAADAIGSFRPSSQDDCVSRTALRTIRDRSCSRKAWDCDSVGQKDILPALRGDSWWARMTTEHGELMLAGILKHPRLRK